MMMLAVSSLCKHVVKEILIPRVKTEIEKTNSYNLKQTLSFYDVFAKDDERCYHLAKCAVTGIKERLSYIRKEDLDDFICNVITSTIQTETNDYHKFLKSRNGFWTTKFDINENPENFLKTFSYFLFKAVQSESRSIAVRFKYEVNIADDENGECSLLTNLADTNMTDSKYEKMTSFEEKINEVKAFVSISDDFDDLDRSIFNRWFALKDTESFNETVNMLQDVYNPLIIELKEAGRDITSSALFFRWKRIRKILKKHLMSGE